jgi:2-dehydro-3-deoxyphosphooctonate aldolase (KDO 8-P synthase)
LEKGLQILQRVQKEFGIPVDTDVHSPEEAIAAGEVCEMIQIPAFLCRQTDLLVAAGNTGRVINLKKGQFMAPWDMGTAVEKIRSTGNKQIILVERGASFGYNNLVSDPRAIPIMQQLGCPVCFDASHSVQLPGGLGKQTGGQSQFIPLLAKVAITAGCQCLFIESHPNPKMAKSDAQSQLDFESLDRLLGELKELHALIQQQKRASMATA